MTSHTLYRYSILGETLEDSLKELSAKIDGNNKEVLDRIRNKFDDLAVQHICHDKPSGSERMKASNSTSVKAIEHEFKFTEGVWKFLLKDVTIKGESIELDVDKLKGNYFRSQINSCSMY